MTNNLELEQAKAHLEQAKTELEVAEQKEKAAETAEKEALHDVDEAMHELEKVEHPDIHFMVNGEPYETRDPEQTPDYVITHFAKKDPATNYLVQIQGTAQISYQGKGEERIRIHDCEQFQTISTGPTPVSAW